MIEGVFSSVMGTFTNAIGWEAGSLMLICFLVFWIILILLGPDFAFMFAPVMLLILVASNDWNYATNILIFLIIVVAVIVYFFIRGFFDR